MTKITRDQAVAALVEVVRETLVRGEDVHLPELGTFRLEYRPSEAEDDAYLDLDVEASYNVTPLLGVVFRVENISGGNDTRWDNYPESPYVIGAGLRVNW